MPKMFILAIFMINAIRCRTSISPAVKLPPLPDSLKEDGNQTVLVYPYLTDAQKTKLQNRYFRHQNWDDNVEFVSNDDYQCRSNWVCTGDAGAWACYCKAIKKIEKP